MKPTDFSKLLTDFLARYMPGELGASNHTIVSYKDTFVLLLTYFRDNAGITADRLSLKDVSKERLVDFLEWVETERKCSPATRNVRLAALHSFFRYVQYQQPENLLEWHKILSIPIKRTEKPTINYLTLEGIRCLLAQPDQSTRNGRRDLALLSLLYDTGARVQEIIDLTPSMVRLDEPCTIKLVGKGNKARIVPLMTSQVQLLKQYMTEHKLLECYANQYPLFHNNRREKLTRAGVNYILAKYAQQARDIHGALIPVKISCHSLRHSKAMHLLQAGVNLVYIRDILGHTSVKATEVYARADSRHKRAALEKAYTLVTPDKAPTWLENGNLLDWLKTFQR